MIEAVGRALIWLAPSLVVVFANAILTGLGYQSTDLGIGTKR
jgi:hypothetical protein